MPISYVIDKDQKTVFTKLYGTLTLKEGLDHHNRLGIDPGFDPTYNELMDGAALESISLNSSGIFELSGSCPFGPESKRAMYSTDRKLYYGLARMFQTLAGGRHGEIRVFKRLDEALEWLNLDTSDQST